MRLTASAETDADVGGREMINDKQLSSRIRAEMCHLRDRLARNPDADPLYWPLLGQLAVSQRPLRDHPRFQGRKPLPPEAGPYVLKWIEWVAGNGVRAIICLLHRKELAYYSGLTGMADGLLAAYTKAGLDVCHLEWADPAHAPTPEKRAALVARIDEIKVQALEAFNQGLKPTLIHCSAAIDRSTPVAAYLAASVVSNAAMPNERIDRA